MTVIVYKKALEELISYARSNSAVRKIVVFGNPILAQAVSRGEVVYEQK